MLNENGFDLWADGYDKSVGLSDEEDSYPFAGYRKVLAEAYRLIGGMQAERVLDVGCGTGILGARLCEAGVKVTGLDFSDRMLDIARERMPEARLIRHDFSQGLPLELRQAAFDAVVSTYAIHHLTDEQKLLLLREMAECVRPGGRVLVGDVAFETAQDRDACRERSGDEWDDEEYYMAMEELLPDLPGAFHCYRQLSHCAGLLEIIV